MCSTQEQTLFQVKDSHESAMHVNEDTVSRRLGATNKTCLYFIIATLVALLVFALATIIVLVVQRTGAESPSVQKQHSHSPSVTGLDFPDQGINVDSERQVPQETQGLAPKNTLAHGHTKAADPAMEGIAKPIRTGNTSEDYLRILQDMPIKTATAYMRVSHPVNSSKLSLVEKGICEDIQCKSEEVVIQKQGLYLIYCHLNFHFPSCSNRPIDLKIEFLVNDKVNRQTLSTWCESETCKERTFKTLFQLHLTYLDVKDRISVTLNHPKFLNVISLPNDNVLGVLRYSD